MMATRVGRLLLWLALWGMAALTAVSFLGRWFDFVELVVSFRPIFTLLTLLLLLGALGLRHRHVGLLALLLLILNGSSLLPYYWPQSTAKETNLRVLLYNADKNHLPYAGVDNVVALIVAERPDVAVLLEVGEAQSAELRLPLSDSYPYQLAHQDVSSDGFLILSRFPLGDAAAQSIGGGRLAATAAIEVEQQVVQIVAPHPTNPMWDLAEHRQQMVALETWIDSAEMPLIVAGDLNTTLWSIHHGAIERSGVRNTRRGQGILPTWEAPYFGILLPLDHILISDTIELHQLRRGASLGSDHRPLIADLLIR